jgi:hypothetical protein
LQKAAYTRRLKFFVQSSTKWVGAPIWSGGWPGTVQHATLMIVSVAEEEGLSRNVDSA